MARTAADRSGEGGPRPGPSGQAARGKGTKSLLRGASALQGHGGAARGPACTQRLLRSNAIPARESSQVDSEVQLSMSSKQSCRGVSQGQSLASLCETGKARLPYADGGLCDIARARIACNVS